MGLVLVTQPTEEPVSLALACSYLNIAVGTDQDAVILSCQRAAREYCEAYLDLALHAGATYRWTIDSFLLRPDGVPSALLAGAYASGSFAPNIWPSGGYAYDDGSYGLRPLEVPRPLLKSVSSITYVDTTGATQTWAGGNYLVAANEFPGRISPAYNTFWPATRWQPGAVTVNYVAGYATVDMVPYSCRQAIMMLTSCYFENRLPTDNDLKTVNSLLDKARWH
jgi:hypothetical protein